MLLLVTDTSGKYGFVALARAGDGAKPDTVEVIEEVPLAGGTFSAQLVPQIAALLSRNGFAKGEIDALIVVSGPGSFTGLRVGLAAIKALAEVLQRPIVPVSLLEVLARSVIRAAGEPKTRAPVAVVLDAGRDEVFVGQYQQALIGERLGSLECRGESLIPRSELASVLENKTNHWISTPDPSVADFLKRQLGPKDSWIRLEDRPGSREIATVGYRKLQEGSTVTPEQLEANYMRRSDAEIFGKNKS